MRGGRISGKLNATKNALDFADKTTIIINCRGICEAISRSSLQNELLPHRPRRRDAREFLQQKAQNNTKERKKEINAKETSGFFWRGLIRANETPAGWNTRQLKPIQRL